MLFKKGSAAGGAFLVLLLILLGGALYYLYTNLPGKPVELIETHQNQNSNEFVEYSKSKQFYENMRFPEKKIGYKIEEACDEQKTSEVNQAFSILEGLTILEFYPDSTNGKLTIYCSDIEPETKKEGYFVAGEGGPTEVINTTLYGVILSGKISFYRDEKCEKPNIALHELLHALGFDHNNNPDSILFPTLDCDQTIDESIISDINNLYSTNSAPDLKITDVSAIKKGRYMDFKIELINRGLKDASQVFLGVYSDDQFTKEFNLEDLKIGTKKFLDVKNFKLLSRNTKNVKFFVDYGNKVDEIFENNNQIDLTLIEE